MRNWFLLLCAFSLKLQAQEWQLIETHPHGSPKIAHADAKELEYAQEGYLLSETEIQDKIPHGIKIVYYPNGLVKETLSFHKGKKEGERKQFSENGTLLQHTHYKDGKKEGVSEVFSNAGKCTSRYTYNNHLPEGNCEEQSDQGAITYHYSKGLLNDREGKPAYLRTYSDHLVAEQQAFTRGQPDGKHIKYYPNGQKSYQAYYHWGCKQGTEQFFHEDGSVAGEGRYNAEGKPTGEHYRKHPNGKLASTATYDEEGNPKTPYREFDSAGHKITERDHAHKTRTTWYSTGALRSVSNENGQREYYENGKLKRLVPFRNGKKHGLYQQWHKNGQKALEIPYENGKKQGSVLAFYPNGTKRSEDFYRDDLRSGTYQEWDVKDRLIAQMSYERGALHGPCKRWSSNKTLLENATYVHGKREGKREEFYPNGQLKEVAYYRNGEIHGDYFAYYDSGDLKEMRQFERGKPTGRHTCYYPNPYHQPPLIRSICNYDKGVLYGEVLHYYPNRQKESQVSYLEGLLHGKATRWSQEGKKQEEIHYERGSIRKRILEKKEPEGKMVTNEPRVAA